MSSSTKRVIRVITVTRRNVDRVNQETAIPLPQEPRCFESILSRGLKFDLSIPSSGCNNCSLATARSRSQTQNGSWIDQPLPQVVGSVCRPGQAGSKLHSKIHRKPPTHSSCSERFRRQMSGWDKHDTVLPKPADTEPPHPRVAMLVAQPSSHRWRKQRWTRRNGRRRIQRVLPCLRSISSSTPG
ncbi:hypothetical protein CONLIGDRAFT_637723 [Coniochaeta ligniaria NRRL 30616]|uniref:Uncharacterized protein n=1 Tax=Coniochaeta ligniaria NRRL 30616 TaxID=1408157 RepID=A0A1J7IQ83_9PEZI|nr:hypothetical protein CONLIGDRAFT_637723 [Coniochaeta ligniaria NRRL 30616]